MSWEKGFPLDFLVHRLGKNEERKNKPLTARMVSTFTQQPDHTTMTKCEDGKWELTFSSEEKYSKFLHQLCDACEEDVFAAQCKSCQAAVCRQCLHSCRDCSITICSVCRGSKTVCEICV